MRCWPMFRVKGANVLSGLETGPMSGQSHRRRKRFGRVMPTDDAPETGS